MMKKLLLYIILFAAFSMVSCGGMPFFCWIPDTSCHPRMIDEEKNTGIRYLASVCDYYNYGYINHVRNKMKPKRFCYLDVFVVSDRDYRIKMKNKKINADSKRIKESHMLYDSWVSEEIYQGVNLVSFPIKTCLFSNDTLNVLITSDDGDTLMNTSILADESFSEPFRLPGTDSTHIDSLWRESMHNKYVHGKLPRHSSLERKAMEFASDPEKNK